MYYKVDIDETGANRPQDNASLFNQESETFKTMDEVKDFMLTRYGRLPGPKTRKIYRDFESGEPEEIGFLFSYWNRDISHNSKAWYQTDWVTVWEMNQKPVTIQ